MYRDDAVSSRFQRLLNASWPLFRAFGVDVRVHWTILFVPLVFFAQFHAPPGPAWDTGTAALMALAVTLALYATVYIHEMGHIAVGRRFGVPSRNISLSPLGGLAHFESPMPTPQAEIWTALAGPVSQALLVILLAVPYVIYDMTQAAELGRRGQEWASIYQWFMYWQVSLVVFNLLPCYPMDGGRIVRGLLARKMHANKASLVTAQIGYAGAIVIGIVGLAAVFGWGEHAAIARYGGTLMAGIGVSNFFACRQLAAEAQHAASVYEPVEAWKGGGSDEAWKDSIAESERVARAEERREKREAEARRREEDDRRKLKDRIDQLLDRINEAGGVEKLTAAERRELAQASELLRREVAER